LEDLPPDIRALALTRLTAMTFPAADLNSLHVDQTGAPYYICTFSNTTSAVSTGATSASAKAAANIPVPGTVYSASAPNPAALFPGILADVPITSPPIRHSRPGATRVLFLDFSGHVITNTAWNNNLKYSNVPRWDCLPFDTDGNTNTFSPSEQTYIIQIWERVSEDYAPFDVDVTTEQPTHWTTTTGHALITPDTDANGLHCPHYGSGGIAYVDVFGHTDYSYNYAACHSPAFVLPMSGSSYADTAEAVSHELGHNMGLSHDGYAVPPTTNEYYGGHGSGDTSWGPIMGTGYGRNVSQWSKGEYYGANNPQDDLAIIAGKAPYRADEHGNTLATATLLVTSNGSLVSSGLISSNTDVDVLSFVAGAGALSLTIFPYRCTSGTYGGNLDVQAQLFDGNGTLVASDNRSNLTQAIINYSVPAARQYYLLISNSGTGNPTNSSPTGYTAYGSIGQYFVTGKAALTVGLLVQSPNGGDLWYKSQTNTISWSSGTNVGGTVNIELYLNGSRYSAIVTNATNTGSYAWNLAPPLLSSTNYLIHLSSATHPEIWDESDATFTIATVPSMSMLFENFDATNRLPAGWTQTNLSGSATSWKVQSGGYTGGFGPATAYSGPYNACLYDGTSQSDVCRLSTPALNMTGYTGAVLRFWLSMQQWGTDQDTLNVWVKTNAAASWFWIAGFTNFIASWTQQSIPLLNLSTHYTIGFVGNAKNGFGVCLDDVEVIGYPADINVATNNTPLQWLADYHLEPSDAGAMSDTDHDGMKAWEEWVAGTCPTQASSVLKVSNSWNAATGQILQWPTVTGRTYSVSWSSNLATAAFSPIVTNTTIGLYTDTVHTVEQSSFYRIGAEISP